VIKSKVTPTRAEEEASHEIPQEKSGKTTLPRRLKKIERGAVEPLTKKSWCRRSVVNHLQQIKDKEHEKESLQRPKKPWEGEQRDEEKGTKKTSPVPG